MSHFAQIDDNNIVIQVAVGNNEDPNGDEGYQFFVDNFGGRWIKTSYNTKSGVHYDVNGKPDNGIALRKNYAGIGFTYDEKRDAFIPPKRFASWVLDEETCQWKPPIPMPPLEELVAWKWNEESILWVKVPIEEFM